MRVSTDLYPQLGSDLKHLLYELGRIDLLIANHAISAIKENKGKSEYRGLFISDKEIEYLSKRPIGLPTWKPTEDRNGATGNSESIHALAPYTNKQSENTKYSKLYKLADIFDLTDLDINTLLLGIAPELDLKYEKIYAYLQDDIARKHPSIDLILNLLCDTFEQKLKAIIQFEICSPLVKHHLIDFVKDPHFPDPPLLRKSIKVDHQIVRYLLGKSGIDERLQPFTRLEIPCVQLQDLILPTDLKNELINLSSRPEIVNHGMTFHLMGSYGVGKHSTASAISHGIGKKILRIDTLALVKSEFMNFDKRLELVNREALINSAVAYWENFDCLLVEEYQSLLRLFLSYLNRQTRIVFISGKKTWKPKAGLHKNPYISFMIPLPKYIARVGLWEKAINGNFAFETNIDVGSLSNRFILSGGQIEDIIVTAKNRTLTNRPDNSLINIKDLYSACRAHSNQNLNDLAQKITPKLTWDDIVLPRDKQALLKEIINHVKHKQRVYVDWGFERKMSLGKGLTVLFSGASGTGKTLAAEIIAGELDLEIYKIDLSLIVSKYIGETEKNLAKIFSEAETSNAILFFDEADALFGKRSEVKDSHDRYANIEIAYLLQKMEEYEGITILASNLRKNLDEAFVRRIKYIIEFPLPDESHRYQIWQVHLPQQAPLGDDLDFEFLAKKFKLTGGNIKNTILHAAFLSVADESPIRMEHIIHGIQREFQKSGKVCVKGDFGPYFNLLSENNLR